MYTTWTKIKTPYGKIQKHKGHKIVMFHHDWTEPWHYQLCADACFVGWMVCGVLCVLWLLTTTLFSFIPVRMALRWRNPCQKREILLKRHVISNRWSLYKCWLINMEERSLSLLFFVLQVGCTHVWARKTCQYLSLTFNQQPSGILGYFVAGLFSS